MRILIRTSRWSIWARRLGSVAVPLVVIAVLLHRLELVTSNLFLAAATAGGLVALMAVLVSIIALCRLWQTGDQGWSRALTGLLFGIICLVPYGWYGNLALRYPQATDVTTTDRALLPILFEPDTAAMPAPHLLTAAALAQTFPNVETRTYPLGQSQTFAVVRSLVLANDWEIRLEREPEQINARIMTLPGWREEVVLHIAGTATTSSVDMRSVSLNALHDLGSNGLRIEAFLTALDEAVTTLLRDNPNANQPVEADPNGEEPEGQPAPGE